MHLFFGIVLGCGLAAACGLRPFLPAVMAGGAGAANLRVNFAHTQFSFLEATAWIVVMALCAAVVIALDRRLRGERLDSGPPAAALSGLALGLGAVLFAGVLASRGYTWWPGILGGLACAALANAATRGLFARVRARLDPEARGALPVYVEGGALLSAALVLLFPPLAILLLGFLGFLLAGSRRRAGEKYAGLRILR